MGTNRVTGWAKKGRSVAVNEWDSLKSRVSKSKEDIRFFSGIEAI